MALMSHLARIARRLTMITLVGVVAAGCSQASGSGSSAAGSTRRPVAGASRSGAAGSGQGSTAAPVASPAASATPWPVVMPVPPARRGLHQTHVLPPAASPDFHAEMVDLWAAVASDRPRLGLPAFFPLVAYQQLKAIGNPSADWRYRLVAEYNSDIRAAHALLGGRGRRARLVRVIVPESQADWIYPGVCSNYIGYWHAANARLVYRVGGQTRSFGIATLISWRGRWYVVHLGGELRTTSGGMVDQPSVGPGVPGPPGGC